MLAGTVTLPPPEMHNCEEDKEELVEVDNAACQKILKMAMNRQTIA